MERELSSLIKFAETVTERIDRGGITPHTSAREVRAHLEKQFDLGRPTIGLEVLTEVTEMLERWQVQVTHPRYFGLYNPSVTPGSVAADTLVAAYNPQLAAWSHSPAANEIEGFTLAAIAERLGFDPETTAAHFTSGGGEANLTAVVAALAHRVPDWRKTGVRGLPFEPRIYLSREGHHSIQKAVRVTGLGADALVTVATDSAGRMRTEALEAAIEADRQAGRRPLAVVATAGTTGAGALDPVAEIAELCQRQDLWLHVDAAWGGAAALSPSLRPHVAGLEQADSLTFDAHKWLSVPMAAGMFFCRHRSAIRAAFGQHTPYMPATEGGEVEDPFSHSLQWSRRFIGLKVFVTLAEAGFSGIAERLEHQAAIGDRLRRRLIADGWRIGSDTPLPVVCFTRDGLDVEAFLARLLERQIAWMSPIRIAGGEPLVRACITSYKTTREDIDEVADQLLALAEEEG